MHLVLTSYEVNSSLHMYKRNLHTSPEKGCNNTWLKYIYSLISKICNYVYLGKLTIVLFLPPPPASEALPEDERGLCGGESYCFLFIVLVER